MDGVMMTVAQLYDAADAIAHAEPGAAARVQDGASAAALPDPPADPLGAKPSNVGAQRKPGRPRGSKTKKRTRKRSTPAASSSSSKAADKPAPEPPAPAVPDPSARVPILALAFLATGQLVVSRLGLEPEFGVDSAQVLAEAWDPVLAQYAPAGPLPAALVASGIVLAPYVVQLAARQQNGNGDTPPADPGNG